MTQPLFHSEQLAAEWATRICDRLQQMGVPTTEVEETRNIIFIFTRIASDELSKNRQIKLPYTEQLFEIEAKQAHQIIDLFIRGVNHTSKKLRDTKLDWEKRREHLENLAWKIFNLAKIMVGMMYIPNPEIPKGLSSEKELQLMMKQAADTIFREQVQGIKGTAMPLNLNWRP